MTSDVRAGLKNALIHRLHDEANMKQTYFIYTCMTCAQSLLHVCLMFASSCKRGITAKSCFSSFFTF